MEKPDRELGIFPILSGKPDDNKGDLQNDHVAAET